MWFSDILLDEARPELPKEIRYKRNPKNISYANYKKIENDYDSKMFPFYIMDDTIDGILKEYCNVSYVHYEKLNRYALT